MAAIRRRERGIVIVLSVLSAQVFNLLSGSDGDKATRPLPEYPSTPATVLGRSQWPETRLSCLTNNYYFVIGTKAAFWRAHACSLWGSRFEPSGELPHGCDDLELDAPLLDERIVRGVVPRHWRALPVGRRQARARPD